MWRPNLRRQLLAEKSQSRQASAQQHHGCPAIRNGRRGAKGERWCRRAGVRYGEDSRRRRKRAAASGDKGQTSSYDIQEGGILGCHRDTLHLKTIGQRANSERPQGKRRAKVRRIK